MEWIKIRHTDWHAADGYTLTAPLSDTSTENPYWHAWIDRPGEHVYLGKSTSLDEVKAICEDHFAENTRATRALQPSDGGLPGLL